MEAGLLVYSHNQTKKGKGCDVVICAMDVLRPIPFLL